MITDSCSIQKNCKDCTSMKIKVSYFKRYAFKFVIFSFYERKIFILYSILSMLKNKLHTMAVEYKCNKVNSFCDVCSDL